MPPIQAVPGKPMCWIWPPSSSPVSCQVALLVPAAMRGMREMWLVPEMHQENHSGGLELCPSQPPLSDCVLT